MNLNSILAQFRKFFPTQWINSFAKQTGLVTRSTSRFDGKDICQLLIQAVNAPSELSLGSFCKILYQINDNAKLKIQSLWERLVNRKTIAFMEGIYAKTWAIYAERIKKDCSKYPCNFFENFSQILIEDSTIIELNEKLSSFFKGCGGSASKSSLKIHLIFNAISNKFCWLKIYKDKRPDNSLAYDVLQVATEGTLLIRDLGFFVLDAFKRVNEKKAYFISRLQPNVNVYLKSDDSKPIDLIRYIKTKYKLFSSGSLDVFLGVEEKLPVRLIFYRAPEEVVNERKRKAKRNRQRKGGTASDYLLTWQEYTLVITNLSEKIAPTNLIGTIYRLRWDIELIFKTWKSHLRLDVLKGARPERIEVFLYAKLICVLLLGMVCNYLKVICLRMFANVEISETKVGKFLVSMNILGRLFNGYLSNAITEFLSNEYWLEQFCKQKRKRKTTLERITALESFGITIC